MKSRRFADLRYPEVERLDRDRTVLILPLGAVEAHGPHLPLRTDQLISEAMAESGAARLVEAGLECLILPTLIYSPAGFAAGFHGTVTIRPETMTALVYDIAVSLGNDGFRYLALANSHLDPANLQSIYDAVGKIRTETDMTVAFPDITRKPWALRLTDEFRSGACHAGRYEGSIVLSCRADLVEEGIRSELPENPASLSRAIWKGLKNFEEAGGPRAYFGDPAAATAAEGEQTIAALGDILAESVLAKHRREE